MYSYVHSSPKMKFTYLFIYLFPPFFFRPLHSKVFTKCKASLQDGPRLENISWRLWYREMAIPTHYQYNGPPTPLSQSTSPYLPAVDKSASGTGTTPGFFTSDIYNQGGSSLVSSSAFTPLILIRQFHNILHHQQIIDQPILTLSLAHTLAQLHHHNQISVTLAPAK